jgi:hypothetical protein
MEIDDRCVMLISYVVDDVANGGQTKHSHTYLT